MLRGYPVDGEVCEVAGFGPVSTQAVLDTLDCGDPVLKAVVTKGHDVVTVAHLGRRPNAHQQTALDWMFPVCAAEGCGTRAAYLETDHRLEWAKSRSTVLGLLDRLCKFHHDRKTYEGWPWSTGGASGRSCLPMTPATLVMGLALRRQWARRKEKRSMLSAHDWSITEPARHFRRNWHPDSSSASPLWERALGCFRYCAPTGHKRNVGCKSISRDNSPRLHRHFSADGQRRPMPEAALRGSRRSVA